MRKVILGVIKPFAQSLHGLIQIQTRSAKPLRALYTLLCTPIPNGEFLGVFWCVCFYGRKACGILVPQPGIEPGPSSVKAWSPNHLTAREVPFMMNMIEGKGGFAVIERTF